MVYIEKSQPAPVCLATEEAKAYGDYKCGDVLERTKNDFFNKCYICEYKEPVTINVEHFKSHQGNKTLKFDWNNLFWSCAHCNLTKSTSYDNLLNCTDSVDEVETAFEYKMNPFPHEEVEIKILKPSLKAIYTQELILKVFNGTTKLKSLEAANLKTKLLLEIQDFQKDITDYYNDGNDEEMNSYFFMRVKRRLSRKSNFAAFKRWIIRNNVVLRAEFESHFD